MTTRTAFPSRLLGLAMLLLLVAMWVSALPARAQAPTPSDDQVNQIARQLYCPVCENVPLDVCPTEACRQWRELIRMQLAEGRGEEEIKQYFVENYGARVLAVPPRSGWNWLVYVLPPVMIVGGAWVLLRALRSWTKPRPPMRETAPAPAPGQAKYVAELEEELKKRS